MTLLELVVSLGVGTVVAGGILVSGDKLLALAADKYGQCKGMCAEIIAHDKQVNDCRSR